MDWLLSFINTFWDVLLFILKAILVGAVGLQIFIMSCVLIGLFAVVYAFISILDIGSFITMLAANWGYLDANTAYLIVQTGFPTGLTMLALAYTIRFMINLIPAEFTRI